MKIVPIGFISMNPIYRFAFTNIFSLALTISKNSVFAGIVSDQISTQPINDEDQYDEEDLENQEGDYADSDSLVTNANAMVETTTPSPVTAINIIVLIVFLAIIAGIIACVIHRIRKKFKKQPKGNLDLNGSPDSAQSDNRSSVWSNTGD